MRAIALQDETRRWWRLERCFETYCAKQSTSPAGRSKKPRNALPDGEAARGKKDIVRAWFSVPTYRYRHGALGDELEAGGLSVLSRANKVTTLTLDVDHVFEDLRPRLADLDGDGRDEIIVILSHVQKGAALAVYKLRADGLALHARTPFHGERFRWLNPVGISDFDGDKKLDIALIRTPHRKGMLEYWHYEAGALRRHMKLSRFSNHVFGARSQNLAALADIDGDRVNDIIVPGERRMSLRIISYARRQVAQIAQIKLPAKVVTQIIPILAGEPKRPTLVVGLEGKKLAIIQAKLSD